MAVLSRRDRTAETRKANETALLQAALDLMDEGMAFAGLGIEQIVKRAGLSRPTFYAYFDDKRAMVLRMGEQVHEELQAAAGPWLGGEDVPLRDTLAAVLAVFRRNAPAVRAVVEAATYDEEVATFWRAFTDSFRPGAQQRIAEGFPKLAPEQIEARAFALVVMTEGTLVEQVSRPAADEEALLDQLAWFWAAATRRTTRR